VTHQGQGLDKTTIFVVLKARRKPKTNIIIHCSTLSSLQNFAIS